MIKLEEERGSVVDCLDSSDDVQPWLREDFDEVKIQNNRAYDIIELCGRRCFVEDGFIYEISIGVE